VEQSAKQCAALGAGGAERGERKLVAMAGGGSFLRLLSARAAYDEAAHAARDEAGRTLQLGAHIEGGGHEGPQLVVWGVLLNIAALLNQLQGMRAQVARPFAHTSTNRHGAHRVCDHLHTQAQTGTVRTG